MAAVLATAVTTVRDSAVHGCAGPCRATHQGRHCSSQASGPAVELQAVRPSLPSCAATQHCAAFQGGCPCWSMAAAFSVGTVALFQVTCGNLIYSHFLNGRGGSGQLSVPLQYVLQLVHQRPVLLRPPTQLQHLQLDTSRLQAGLMQFVGGCPSAAGTALAGVGSCALRPGACCACMVGCMTGVVDVLQVRSDRVPAPALRPCEAGR